MNRKAFYHLLKRYVENDCTDEERKLVEQWYELLGDEEGIDPGLPPEEIKESLERLWPRIQQHTLVADTGKLVSPRIKDHPNVDAPGKRRCYYRRHYHCSLVVCR